ncbi:PQ loop repeat-domain-containing protein [Scheffersomyces amazonensis]|uniref:PQ loop repeat-domain-containing protein n=1 Tax=Scheffersomyces amazonensis TaxID=1078765 RepID=UPI00315D7810
MAFTMAPPPPIVIDAQAVSGITGSISIACWIIVFAPQIYENFRRKSSEGLSLSFVILWLAGDVFNVLGSVLQGVLPTMIILAIYYTFADIVLLWQCLAYGDGEGKTDLIHLSPANPMNEDVLETVLSRERHQHHHNYLPSETEDESVYDSQSEQSQSQQSQQVQSTANGSTLDLEYGSVAGSSTSSSSSSSASSLSIVQSILIKILMVALVILAGIIGWYISYSKDSNHPSKPKHPQDLVFDPLAQFFGWLCAILYLGSRIPQIILNFERKSCEGISFMFFLFACLGNLTYVVSILAIDMSWHYLWVNSSWLAGSLGTFALDFTIFVQFFLYNENNSSNNYSELEQSEESSLLTSQQQSQLHQQSYGAST